MTGYNRGHVAAAAGRWTPLARRTDLVGPLWDDRCLAAALFTDLNGQAESQLGALTCDQPADHGGEEHAEDGVARWRTDGTGPVVWL